MFTDPIADLLTRIRNANMRGHQTVVIPHSRIKEQIAQILKEHKFIKDTETVTNNKFKEIVVTLDNDKDELTLTRVSKPGQRIYIKNKELTKVKSGLGIGIISTSQGIMTTHKAKAKGLGGELICEIH